ncbi:hypothetical protein [Micromonospora sp. RV43]|uniref:hypothetical protein n=1 Tax=Micromonospora sp. RV43 TaxID=1661387 RepID=UPI00064C491A|nr:hypothetical protein [Micromonospora sp. RV43]
MITVYGASDDLIEIDGDISEEFGYHNEDKGDLLAFSDGTVLRIVFTDAAIWRITTVARGSAELTIEQAPEDDESNYTDRATLIGAVWVVHGLALAR